MFEYFVIPGWVFVFGFFISAVIAGLIFLGILSDTKKSGEPFPIFMIIASPLLIFAISGLIITSTGGLLSVNGSQTTDNPSIVHGAISVFKVNGENMEERIGEEAKLDNVELEDKAKDEMADTLQKGKFVEFIADKDDDSTKGYIYFKNSKMTIVVDQNSENDKIVVPVK